MSLCPALAASSKAGLHPGGLLQAQGLWDSHSESQSPWRSGTATPQSLHKRPWSSRKPSPALPSRDFQSCCRALLSYPARIPADSLLGFTALPKVLLYHNPPTGNQKWEKIRNAQNLSFCHKQGIQMCLHFAPFPPAQLQGFAGAGNIWFANTWTLLRTNLPPSSPQLFFFPCCSVESNKMGKMNHFTSVCSHLSLPKSINSCTETQTPCLQIHHRVGRFIYFGVVFRAFVIVFLRVTNWGLC